MLAMLKKELACYADSPVMYVAAAVFIGIAGYLFYGNLIMLLLLQGSGLDIDLWVFTVNDIRLLVMLLIPVVSMRMIAEEKRLGTIELLFTSPLSEWNIVLGKYFAGMLIIGMLVCVTLLFPGLLSLYYPVEPGPLMSAYGGIMLLCFAITAAGAFLSAITESQLIAAVATAGLAFFLWFIDQNATAEQTLPVRLLSSLSLQKHFYNFNRGVVALKDIIYFSGFSVFFLFLTIETLKLRSREIITVHVCGFGAINIRWLSFAARAVGCSLFFAFCIIQPGIPNARLDLTAGRLYSPSDITKTAFDSLQAPLIVTVGCEGLQKYQYEDFFEQLAPLSPHLHFRLMRIEQNPVAAARMEITKAGSGIAEYNGRFKRIELINEQSIVAAIFELTQDARNRVEIIAAPVKEPRADRGISFAAADNMLSEQGFLLHSSDFAGERGIDSGTKLVIIRELSKDMPADYLEAVRSYFEQGGSILMLLNGGDMPNIARFLKSYNVELGNDFIIDREHGGSGFDELTPVIFFNKEHPAVAECTSLAVFNRVRSVQVGIQPRPGYRVSLLCFSGRGTWAETDMSSALGGSAKYSSGQDPYGPVAAGVSIEKQADSGKSSRGRMVVLGSGSFMADGQRELLGNLDYAKKLIAWLSPQKIPPGFAAEKTMPREPVPLRMTEAQSRIFFWTLVVLMPALFMLAGIGVFCIRRLRH